MPEVSASVVALRKESVDRNPIMAASRYMSAVALRKESVDRNIFGQRMICDADASLSARRAWIEINLSQTFARRWAGRSPQGERG